MSTRAALTSAITEADWTTWVIEVARLHHWRAAHFRPARTAAGWRTAVQGDVGFPDVALARDEEVLIVELKRDAGRLTPEQRAWLAALGPYGRVWRPRDRDDVLATLSAPRRAA